VKEASAACPSGRLGRSADLRLRAITSNFIKILFLMIIKVKVFGERRTALTGLANESFRAPDRIDRKPFIRERLIESVALDGLRRLAYWESAEA